MLGVDSKRPPIKEPYASEIRDAVCRIVSGKLNDQDKQVIVESEEKGRAYHAIWE